MVADGRQNLRWPLGVFVSLDAGLGAALEVAKELAIPTVHLHAPRLRSRSTASRGETKQRLKDSGLEVTCVFAGFDGESYHSIALVEQTVGLVPLETRQARTAELLDIAEFASALDVSQVGVHIGVIPHDSASTGYREIVTVTREVCDVIAAKGQALHLETGQESADVLLTFLNDVQRDNLFVNFDPANMILYGAGEPTAALAQLGRWVRSVHCKDAVWSQQPGFTWGTETPLGEGCVDFEKLLSTLDQLGYEGPLTIEREIPQDPVRQRREIAGAKVLLTALQARQSLAS
jgi:sugar phosphate isomerase/epimerase